MAEISAYKTGEFSRFLRKVCKNSKFSRARKQRIAAKCAFYAGLAAGGVPAAVVACPQYGQQAKSFRIGWPQLGQTGASA